MTGSVDFVCQRNATFQYVLYWSDENSNPIDVSDFQALMQIRHYPNGPVVLEMSSEYGPETGQKIYFGSSDGKITLKLEREITANLKPTIAYYDLSITDTSGRVFRLLEGKFIIVDAITLGTPAEPG